jgi:hypothetical protein
VILFQDGVSNINVDEDCIPLIRAVDPSLSFDSYVRIMGTRSIMITRRRRSVESPHSIWDYILDEETDGN